MQLIHQHKNPHSLLAARDAVFTLIALSGYIYYCYKFGSPDLGNNDFYQYKEMVERPLDFGAAPAPFVLRQLPVVVASLFYVLGIFYDTTTILVLILSGDIAAKKIFFVLILSNAVGVWISFGAALHYIRKMTLENSSVICFSYLGIMLSYFYFPFSIIAPLATGWGWLTSTILSIALLERKVWWVLLGGLLALVTRETILVFAFTFCVLAWLSFGQRARFFLWSASILFAICGVFIVLRSHFIHGHEDQMDVVANLLSFTFSREYLFQAIIPQALLVVLLLSLCNRHWMYAAVLFGAMISVVAVGIGTGEGPGIGRALGETLPFYAIIFVLAKLGALAPAGLKY